MTTNPMQELEKAHSNYLQYLIDNKSERENILNKNPYYMTRDELLMRIWLIGEQLNKVEQKYHKARDLIHNVASEIRHGEWEV